jgi:heme-degrading monooxygenase HmoA
LHASSQLRPCRTAFDGAIQLAGEQLPDGREQPGFRGFYLLADRAAGKLMTISLWASHDDVRAGHLAFDQSRSLSAAGRAASAGLSGPMRPPRA